MIEIRCAKCDKLLGKGWIESYRGNYDSEFYCVEHTPREQDRV